MKFTGTRDSRLDTIASIVLQFWNGSRYRHRAVVAIRDAEVIIECISRKLEDWIKPPIVKGRAIQDGGASEVAEMTLVRRDSGRALWDPLVARVPKGRAGSGIDWAAIGSYPVLLLETTSVQGVTWDMVTANQGRIILIDMVGVEIRNRKVVAIESRGRDRAIEKKPVCSSAIEALAGQAPRGRAESIIDRLDISCNRILELGIGIAQDITKSRMSRGILALA
jgi:hypothetical protein